MAVSAPSLPVPIVTRESLAKEARDCMPNADELIRMTARKIAHGESVDAIRAWLASQQCSDSQAYLIYTAAQLLDKAEIEHLDELASRQQRDWGRHDTAYEGAGEGPMAQEAFEDRLTKSERDALPSSAFALPERRELPIVDREHIQPAASRLVMMWNRGELSRAEYEQAHHRIIAAGNRFGVHVREDVASEEGKSFFKFEAFVGPTAVQDVASNLRSHGIDAHAGTEKVYGGIYARNEQEVQHLLSSIHPAYRWYVFHSQSGRVHEEDCIGIHTHHDMGGALVEAARRSEAAEEDRLTYARRKNLPNSAFALPERRELPLIDSEHIRNAAARLSMMRNEGHVTRAEYEAAHRRIVSAGKRHGIHVSESAGEEAARPHFVTKPGKYGTLYRYKVIYTDASDPAFGQMEWFTWAYNLEDAEERFYDSDEGFKVLSISHVHEGESQHRAVQHRPARERAAEAGDRMTQAEEARRVQSDVPFGTLQQRIDAGGYPTVNRPPDSLVEYYVKRMGLGQYEPGSVMPAGDGIWSFVTRWDGGSTQRRQVDDAELWRVWNAGHGGGASEERGLAWSQRSDGVYWANGMGGTYYAVPQVSGSYHLLWMSREGNQRDLGVMPFAEAMQVARRHDPSRQVAAEGSTEARRHSSGRLLGSTETRYQGWTYKAEVYDQYVGTYDGASLLTKYYRFDGTWKEISWDAVPKTAYNKLRAGVRRFQSEERAGVREPVAREEHHHQDGGWQPPSAQPVCGPWVKMEKDVTRFEACMQLADKIGPIEGHDSLYEFISPQMQREDVEVFYAIIVDTQMKPRGFVEIARGSRDSVMTPVPDTVRFAMQYAAHYGAMGLGIAHFHPSGKAKPSQADHHVTEAVKKGCEAVGICFLDHIVVGHGEYHSFRAKKTFKVKHHQHATVQ
jgi:hypothetical protein